MITVSDAFEANAKARNRHLTRKFWVDWDRDGTFTEETDHLLVLEWEKRVEEPLGGIHSAMADAILSNYDERYTPE